MPRARLSVTPLEDRTVPAAFGNTWVDTNVTYSFAPDGTDVAGTGSNLYAVLGARATEAEWKGAFAAAFSAWAAHTNLNPKLVSDDGRAIGSAGPVQGSPFVGDIRIVARPLSDNVIVITNPFDLVSPWSGEIVVNSNKAFDTDGSAGAYDLFTVLLQEVGHALGVANSDDPNSAMYGAYLGPRAGLGGGDVAAIQALYGTPGAPTNGGPGVITGLTGSVTTLTDGLLGLDTNATLLTATNLGVSRDSGDQRWDFVGGAAFETSRDADVYRVRTTDTSGGVLVAYAGTSARGTAPTVTVYDQNGRAVAAEVLMRQDGATVVQVQGVKANQTYYLAVGRGSNAWGGREQYRVGFDFRTTALQLDTVAQGALAAGQAFVRELQVTRSQGFRFQLSAPAGATLTVYDATGTAVFTMSASGAGTAAGGVLLGAGAYTIVITGTGEIDAKMLATTDPIGPAADDGYAAPKSTTSSSSTSTASTSSTSKPKSASSSGYSWSSEPQSKTASDSYGYAMW